MRACRDRDCDSRERDPAGVGPDNGCAPAAAAAAAAVARAVASESSSFVGSAAELEPTTELEAIATAAVNPSHAGCSYHAAFSRARAAAGGLRQLA